MMLKFLVFSALLCLVHATSELDAQKLNSKKLKKTKIITVTEAPVSCYDQTLVDRNDCLIEKPGYKCQFNLREDDPECSWKCDCVQDIVIKKERIVRKEEPEINIVKKAVKKQIPLKKKKAHACDGIKTFSFKNCGIDIKGLIGWGKETRNFDSKFKKFAGGSTKKRRAPVDDSEEDVPGKPEDPIPPPPPPSAPAKKPKDDKGEEKPQKSGRETRGSTGPGKLEDTIPPPPPPPAPAKISKDDNVDSVGAGKAKTSGKKA